MISFTIGEARKKGDGRGRWWVMHPCNDAILAYCDSEEEADLVLAALREARTVLEVTNRRDDCP